MSAAQLSPEEIRAAAEAHRELGPEYDDAVVQSFLAKVEKEIDARVEARLAGSRPARRRRLDPATLARRQKTLRHMVVGSVVAAIPLTYVTYAIRRDPYAALLAVWIIIAVGYVAGAMLLRSTRRDRD